MGFMANKLGLGAWVDMVQSTARIFKVEGWGAEGIKNFGFWILPRVCGPDAGRGRDALTRGFGPPSLLASRTREELRRV